MKTAERVDDRRSGNITAGELHALVSKQGFRCAITGDELTPSQATADHKVAIKNGGEHRIGNIQIVTKEANRLKGTLTNEQLLEICRKVVYTLGSDGD